MPQRKPEWLKIKALGGQNRTGVEDLLARLSLHTVCQEAACPNLMECYGRRTATFLILGPECTRNCTFCAVGKGTPLPLEEAEPERVALAVRELGLRYAVITSVTRDDLPDGGAGQFVRVIKAIRAICPETSIEVLIPDFAGNREALAAVVAAAPDILNHNVETVPRLYPEVRPMADYQRSLDLLAAAKEMSPGLLTKSGIMVGLGETKEEVLALFSDLVQAGCAMLTVGQYLAPSRAHHEVVEYVHPDTFEDYRKAALEVGFSYVSSGPLVRSSYLADLAVLPKPSGQ